MVPAPTTPTDSVLIEPSNVVTLTIVPLAALRSLRPKKREREHSRRGRHLYDDDGNRIFGQRRGQGGLELITRYRAIIGQGVWVLTGQAFTGLFTLAGTRLVTQVVAPEIYGLVNLAQNTVLLLRTLFCSPILNAGLRYYPDAQRGGYVPALYRMLRGALGKATLVMEALVVAGACVWMWRTRVHAGAILALVVFLYADVFRTLELTMFGAERRQRPAAIASAAEALSKPLLIFACVLMFGARIEIVLGAIAASVVMTLIGVRSIARTHEIGDGSVVPTAVGAEMLKYSLPLIPIALLNWLTGLSDRYIIQWLSHDLVSVGIYAAGYGLVSQPFLLLHAVTALTLRPVYFSAVSREDRAHATRTFRTWLTLSTGICVLAVVLVYLWRNVIVGMLLGPQYRAASVVVPWIALGYLFYVIEQILEQNLLAHKRTRSVLYAQAWGAGASIAVTVPLVAACGMVGAAYACPIYFLIQCMAAGLMVLRGRDSNL
jgi:O-antigen/teichoic acid export membrane protein